jgi:hypothetical protein
MHRGERRCNFAFPLSSNAKCVSSFPQLLDGEITKHGIPRVTFLHLHHPVGLSLLETHRVRISHCTKIRDVLSKGCLPLGIVKIKKIQNNAVMIDGIHRDSQPASSPPTSRATAPVFSPQTSRSTPCEPPAPAQGGRGPS